MFEEMKAFSEDLADDQTLTAVAMRSQGTIRFLFQRFLRDEFIELNAEGVF